MFHFRRSVLKKPDAEAGYRRHGAKEGEVVRKLSLILMIFLSGPADAASEAAPTGYGAMTCTQFANAIRAVPAVEDQFFTWAQGFMSGLNFASSDGRQGMRNLTATEVNAQQERIRHYCDEHRFGNYLEAVLDLYNSLPPNSE